MRGNTGLSDAMQVGVIDDGSRRDGFAQYVCLATIDFPDRPRAVGIMDVTASAYLISFHSDAIKD